MPKKEGTRLVYVKDDDLSRTGFARVEEAWPVKEELMRMYPEPEFRVRNRYRSRTGLWDVLVKRRTEVRTQRPRTPAEVQAERDLEFIADHALTGR